MTSKQLWFWTTLVIWLALDQGTKLWVNANLEYRVDEVVLIPGYLSIIHAENPGAAFSMLVDFEYRHYVFGVFTVAALFIVADMYRKMPSFERWMAGALGLILSGVLGNAIDRVHKGTVTDMVRCHADEEPLRSVFVTLFGSPDYPTWNIADAALLIGVVMFVFQSMFSEGGETEPAGEAPKAEPGSPGPG